MSDVIVFYPTNKVTDPGIESTTSEVADRFWASDEAKEWLAADNAGRLERLALNWVGQNVGQWSNLDDWGPIFEAIRTAMPRNR